MGKEERFRRPEQLNLFHPPRIRPSWRDLPGPVRQRVVELMGKMLLLYQEAMVPTLRREIDRDE